MKTRIATGLVSLFGLLRVISWRGPARRGARRLQAIVGGMALLGLVLLPSVGTGGIVAMGPASVLAADPDPDLCALLPTGAGWTVTSTDHTQYCKASNPDGDTRQIEITKYSSPDAARAGLTTQMNASGGKWEASTRYGDSGYGFDRQPFNLDYPGGAFARGCYVVLGVAWRYPADAEKMRDFLAGIDRSLSNAPCGGGGPPPTLKVVYAGANTVCGFKQTEAGLLQILGGPAKNRSEVRKGGEADVFLLTDDGTAIQTSFGSVPAGGRTRTMAVNRTFAPDILPLNYGTELKIPGLTQRFEDRWLLEIQLGDGEYQRVGPTGNFKIPCNPQEAVKISLGILETIIKLNATTPSHKIETDNAIITPGGTGRLLSVDSANAQADPNAIGIRLSVDARDPAKTGITLYAGTVQVAPKSGGAPPVTLTAGQHVDVSQAGVSAATNVIDVPGINSQTFPETGKIATGIFMDYWSTHGGLSQQGYPISGLLREKSDLNGQTYTIQYFERAVFEFHPEFAPPNDVLLSQLGTFQYKKKYPNGAPAQRPNQANGKLFTETNHWVGGKFYQYWQEHGGLAQQGLPLSDEFTEISDQNGKPYTVQYFERAVFEDHPEFAAPNDVLLSLLGAFSYDKKYKGGGGGPGPTAPTATPGGGGGGGTGCSLTTNIAAASNGGSIAGASSDFGLGWQPQRIIDGDLNTGWASNNGANTNQYVIVALPRGQTYNINKVRINPWNTAPSCCPDDATKDFEIRVSTTDANPASFRTVFRGTTPKENAFFDFSFSVVQAKYVMLFVINNYGGRWIEVKEFEVYQACTGGGGSGGNPTPITPPPPPPPGATATPISGGGGGGQCDNIPAPVNMTITPSNCARAGSSFVFEAFGFNPGETIGAYATGPDGSVYGANFQLTADANGAIRSPNGVTLTTATNTPPGLYALTMEGVTSHRRAIGYVKLLAP